MVNGKGRITYTYDAAGALLQKAITDTKLNTKTVITYIAGFVYQKILPADGNATTVPDTLQYLLHEEGRIRYTISSTSWAYDYFLKDHLGNIRSVVTSEQRTDAYPPASLETANITNEKIYYRGLDNGVVNKSTASGYPSNDTYTNPNDFIQKLSGTTNITGAGILLKVMAGDKINVHASSWYKLNGVTPDQPVSPLPDLINALLNGVPGISGNKVLPSQLNSGILNPSLTGFLNTRDATGNSTRPVAWLNIIVLDEQLNPVITSNGKNSYYEQVGPGNTSTVKQYNISGREITKNGYVYIYVSNETPNVNVYWDNLQVTHVRGALLQEEGYYPFGLEMKALSTQAAAVITNKYKFNAGTELEKSFDVSYYETFYRNYDPQIGRFTGIDSKSEATKSISPYQFVGNNPISFVDPLGDLKAESIDDIINRLWNSPNGGQWSSSNPGTLYYYGDEATANIFGTLAAVGMQYDFGGGGGGGNSLKGNLFNTTRLTKAETQKFNALIGEINTTNIGTALINALIAFQKFINVTHDPLSNPLAMAEYHYEHDELRMDDRLTNTDWNFNILLLGVAHELFHAYQDFSGLNMKGDGNEPDAYIFESLFGRQYSMDEAFYNSTIVENPSTISQQNFAFSWNSFFNNGYSRADYSNIYSNFLEGSVDGNHYNGPIVVTMGGYLIYKLLKP